MRTPISLLRKLYVRLVIFLDNILLMASSKEELALARGTLKHLQNLALLINRKKTVLEPCQNIQFLGMEVNSIEMTLLLPQEKKRKIVKQCQDLSTGEVISFHKGTKPISWLPCSNSNCSSASASAVTTHFRIAENRGLQLKNEFAYESEGRTVLVVVKTSFNQGKINNFCISSVNKSFQCFFIMMGSFFLGHRTGGSWTLLGSKCHINVSELKTKFAILTFTRMHSSVQSLIHLQIDNIVAFSYLVRIEVIHNNVLSDISK